MAEGKYVAYYRVSTARQGRSGLGLEAQREAVRAFLAGRGWPPVAEFTEVESGKRSDRPELAAALTACRSRRATLVVAKLDRLSRDAAFLLTLQNAGVEFVCADMPEANRLTVGLMAVIAQHEREMIARRTREALAAAKARGVKLGGYRPGSEERIQAAVPAAAAARTAAADARASLVAGYVREMQREGCSLRKIAELLNAGGHVAPRGGAWSPVQVARLLRRLGSAPPATGEAA